MVNEKIFFISGQVLLNCFPGLVLAVFSEVLEMLSTSETDAILSPWEQINSPLSTLDARVTATMLLDKQ